MSFDSLDLDQRLKENLQTLNFVEMTPIQEQALPIILKGEDLIAQAKTGSGKTVAFGLGVINSLDIKNTRTQSLILCPTRELSEQVATELRTLCRSIPHIKILTLTGGKSEYHQEKSLAHGAHIIVGTPGRIRKLLMRKILQLSHVKSFVLDEADRMLDMGFEEDLKTITNYVPEERQSLLFSATFPDNIRDLAHHVLLPSASEVKIEEEKVESSIEELFFQVESHKDKLNCLLHILSQYQPERFIVFCKTKRIADDTANALEDKGLEVESIHGDLEQRDRDLALTMFSNKSLSGLIATDVAARGIDIKSLEMVVNFDLTPDPEVYVHRIGRTGRAGEKGLAVSIVVIQEAESIQKIEEYKDCIFNVQKFEKTESAHDYVQKPKMATLYISGGKRDKLRPGDIVGAIVGEAKIGFEEIGDINIGTISSYVAVNRSVAQLVSKSLQRGKIKNRKFKVGIID